MDRKSEIIELIKNTIRESIPDDECQVFIFGSQANQVQLVSADIDVGIKSTVEIEKSAIARIKFELNEKARTLFTFDIIDFSKVSVKFESVALLNIENI